MSTDRYVTFTSSPAGRTISRRLGHFDDAIAGFKRASDLAPHSAAPSFNLAQVYAVRRQYAEADRYFASAAAVNADPDLELVRRATNALYWKGDLGALQNALDVAKARPEFRKANGTRMFEVAWWSRDYATAAKVCEEDASDNWADGANVALPKRLYLAWAEEAAGDGAKAHAQYLALRKDLETSLREHPDVAENHLALGFADAGLGMRDEALAEGRKSIALLPVSVDAFTGPALMGWVARLDVRAGAHEAAIDLIQQLQAMPAGHTLSQALLKVDPIWDPLRSEPKFQTLLSKPDLVITRDATRG